MTHNESVFEQEKSIALNRLREGGVAVVVGGRDRMIPDIILRDPRFYFIKGDLSKRDVSIPSNARVVIINRFSNHDTTNEVRKQADKKGLHVFFWPQINRLRELQVPPVVREVREDVVTISNEGRLPPDREPENVEELPPPSETMAYIPIEEVKEDTTMIPDKSLKDYLAAIPKVMDASYGTHILAKSLLPELKKAGYKTTVGSVTVTIRKLRMSDGPSAKMGRPKKAKHVVNEPAPNIQHVVSVPNSNNENSLLEAIDEAIIHLQLVKERIQNEMSPEAMKKKVREHLLKMMD